MTRIACLSPYRRPGFTLVELLVALGIVVLIAGLAVLVVPRFQEQQKTYRGADQLQGWLLIAKQWALRDQAPRGLRLQPDPNNPNHAYRLYYIEQPDDLIPRNSVGAAAPLQASGTTVSIDVPFATLGSLVQPNDYVQIQGGLVHRIIGVAAATLPQTGTLLTLASPTLPVLGTTDYRIIRKPRDMANEKPLDLTRDIIIDLSLSQYRDTNIVFTPNGAVTGTNAATDRIVLWVRDGTLDSPVDGSPTLITVYTRTGFITAHPVNTDPSLGDYYIFTRSNRGSGL